MQTKIRFAIETLLVSVVWTTAFIVIIYFAQNAYMPYTTYFAVKAVSVVWMVIGIAASTVMCFISNYKIKETK